jgi:hypothetical protein
VYLQMTLRELSLLLLLYVYLLGPTLLHCYQAALSSTQFETQSSMSAW